MRSLTSKDAQQKAQRLYELIQQRLDAEKNEKALKTYFKDILGDESAVRVGEYIVTVVNKSRQVLDRDILVEKFGEEAIREFEKPLKYQEVSVTPQTEHRC